MVSKKARPVIIKNLFFFDTLCFKKLLESYVLNIRMRSGYELF